MKLEDFLAGVLIGVAGSDKSIQRLVLGATQKVASFTVDNLNKRGDLNAPTTIQPKPIPEPPTEQDD